MKISQRFTVARPLIDVWEFFQDIPAVARCMPGAELTEDKGDGLYAGRVKARLGPFGASFEGEAKVTSDETQRCGHVEGKGVDKRGGSRTRMVMDYRLAEVAGGTEVSVDAGVTLTGAIAQFGRTSLMQETANILVRDFAGALEAQLAPGAATPAAEAQPEPEPPDVPAAAPRQAPGPAADAVPGPREIRAGSVGLRGLWAWLKSLLRGLLSGSGAPRR